MRESKKDRPHSENRGGDCVSLSVSYGHRSDADIDRTCS